MIMLAKRRSSSRLTSALVVVFTLATSSLATSCARPRGNDIPGARSTDVIYLDEIQGAKAQNALDAVRRLRPRFLQSRGQTSLLARRDENPVVYLDNRRYGDIESLRMIPTEGIFEIRYLSPNQAQQRWGMNHSAGVIHVTSMSGRAVQG